MHCPRCGQQQINEETKFCSKCGFQLHVVSAVLMHGGSLPQLDLLNQPKKKALTRRNGMVFSLFWVLFFLLIMTPFFGIMGVEEMAGVSAIFGIFGGLIIFLASAFFLEGKPKLPYYYPHPPMPHQMPQYPQQQMQYPQQMQGQQQYQQGALPPQQQQPIPTYTPPPHVAGSWRDTNDFGRPSVTEDSTRLLQREEE